MDFAALDAQLRNDVSEPISVSYGVSTNFVVSLDGRITLDGRSGHMAGPADKTVFQLLRAASDAVVVGVSTAEAEHYGMPAVPPALVELRRTAGLPDQPRLVLASNSGKVHLEHTRFGKASDPRPSPAVMLAVPGAIRERVAAEYPIFDVIAAGDHEMEPPCLVQELTRLGMPRINCEGGPRLLQAFLQTDAVATLNLTIAPRLIGGAGIGLLDDTPLTFSPDDARCTDQTGEPGPRITGPTQPNKATTDPGAPPADAEHVDVARHLDLARRWNLEHLAVTEGDVYVRYGRPPA